MVVNALQGDRVDECNVAKGACRERRRLGYTFFRVNREVPFLLDKRSR